jgi:hypothetical protein
MEAGSKIQCDFHHIIPASHRTSSFTKCKKYMFFKLFLIHLSEKHILHLCKGFASYSY